MGGYPNYEPPVTGGGSSTVDVVSNVATARILGRASSGSGDSEELTAAQVRSLLGDPWVTITDTTLSVAAASFSVNVTGYNHLEIVMFGYADNNTNGVGVRCRLNDDTGNNYLNNAGGATSAWNSVGTFPGALTNTDRNGLWEAVIGLGHTTRDTVGVFRNAHRLSDSATGATITQGAMYYTNLSAAITSMSIFPSAGSWASGTRLLVRGKV